MSQTTTFCGPLKYKIRCFRCERSVEVTKKTNGGEVVLIMPKTRSQKPRKDLNTLHKRYHSIWIEIKFIFIKNQRKCFRIDQLTCAKQIEIKPLMTKPFSYVQLYSYNLISMGDNNLNYLNLDEKESLDTIPFL